MLFLSGCPARGGRGFRVFVGLDDVFFYDFPELFRGDLAGEPVFIVAEYALLDSVNIKFCVGVLYVACFDWFYDFAVDSLAHG